MLLILFKKRDLYMDNDSIETISVAEVSKSLALTKYLSPFIPDKDKEPSWDGRVYIYITEKKTKNNVEGYVPVQVKGTENEDLSKDSVSYPMSIDDLKNYLHDGGIILFLVYESKSGECKIYYTALTVVKIKHYLETAKGEETRNIKLISFPLDNDEKADIFHNFNRERKKQISFATKACLL